MVQINVLGWSFWIEKNIFIIKVFQRRVHFAGFSLELYAMENVRFAHFFDRFPAIKPHPLEPSKKPKSYNPPVLLTA